MGIGKLAKKAIVGTAKVAGTAVLGSVGIASTVVEALGAGSNIELLEAMGHGLKSASFNGVRSMWGAEKTEYSHSAGDTGRRMAANIRQRQEEILSAREKELNQYESKLQEAEASGAISKKVINEKRASIANARDNLDSATARVRGTNQASKASPHEIVRVPSQIGTTGLAFVFSCPGSKEESAGHVCAGNTGENLQILIDYCANLRPDVFVSAQKGDYTISNASDIVHYQALTGDTEASYTEISDPSNLERIRRDLAGCHTIICMGAKASYAVRHAKVLGKIIQGAHLSASNLNRNYNVEGDSPEERNKARVGIIGDRILRQL